MFADLVEVFRHRALAWSLSKQQVRKRHLGSVFGALWLVLNPLIMLAMYSVVFGVIFQPRWAALSESGISYPIFLFTGLVVFWVFGESVSRAPGVIVEHRNLVKRVRFPVQILPLTVATSALLLFSVNLLLVCMLLPFFGQSFSLLMLLAPAAIVPAWLFSTGLAWLLSALGAYFKDVSQASNILTLAGLFLSGVFYPLEAVPVEFRAFWQLNPIAVSIECLRDVLLYGHPPDWEFYALGAVVGMAVCVLGGFIFSKVRAGFADVI